MKPATHAPARRPENQTADSSRASLAERLLDALPQTQCARCGFPDCRSYAQAMADGQAAINRCAPGGAEGVQRLAALTGQPVLPLDPQFGAEGPRSVAWIDENWCIGCTLCIKACPVDCIVGTSKHMHTVIEDDCTGCKLCVTACPVDCIEMENVSADKTGWQAWSQAQADQARQDYEQTRQRRKVTGKPALPSKPPKTNHPAHGPAAVTGLPTTQKPVLQVVKQDAQRKKDAVAAALARARRRRQAHEA